ncbi:MAG: flagellar basal body P-ring formation chaperone FlgA [Helicobacter sp.]|nr:flagellar basal body P-ring formation chaperone FlgA [Helicobacter sp.]
MKKFTLLFLALINFALADNIDLIKEKIHQNYEKIYKSYDINISKIELELNPNSKINDVNIENIDLEVKNDFDFSGLVKIHFIYENKDFSTSIKYRVLGSLNAIIATQNIKRNAIFSDQNTQIIKLDLDKITTKLISKEDLKNTQAKLFITKNTILNKDHLDKKILIYKNNRFIARYQQGQITIEIQVIAKENGAKDDMIEAINPDTKKVLKVLVLSSGLGLVI